MKMTKKTIFLLLLFLMVLGTVNVNAQVRIGGDTPPDTSVVLDLNPDSEEKADKGLVLPRVNLESLTVSRPLGEFIRGAMVYNLTTDGELNEGVYYSNGVRWVPVISDSSVNAGTDPPIIFLRQPGFLWLGPDGDLTDTLCFELAAVDKSKFTYQWYTRDPVTFVSTPLTGDAAKNDTLFINSNTKDEYDITSSGKIYQFYCVVVSGSQYGISGIGRVVYGSGARLANGGWIKIANANLGANQNMTVEEQINYEPDDDKSGVGDKDYDPTVYGDWYQWGREKDGHENRKVLASGTSDAYWGAQKGVPIHADSLDLSNGQITATNTLVYRKFIQRNAGTDWRQYPETAENSAVSPATDWTWGNPVDGITDLDPCKKAGENNELGEGNWRVPTQAEWAQILSNNTYFWNTKGYEIKPAGINKPTAFFLPPTGGRHHNGGGKVGVSFNGFYWSSTVTNAYAYVMSFNSNTNISAANPSQRAFGFALRCVSE
jgi:uncharacterized protein (TIGR02145 family)